MANVAATAAATATARVEPTAAAHPPTHTRLMAAVCSCPGMGGSYCALFPVCDIIELKLCIHMPVRVNIIKAILVSGGREGVASTHSIQSLHSLQLWPRDNS